jgi:hypothetical protein
MSKKDLLAEAAKLGVDVPDGAKVSEIEAALAEHAAATAQQHEGDAAVPMSVRVQNLDGVVTLVFGVMVPSETDPPVFEGSQAYEISVDDAHLLHHDLPSVIHEALVVNHHSG